MINNALTEIAEKIESGNKIAVFCHIRPDGDAVGAGLSLCLALRNAGKVAYFCCDDFPPDKFDFLPEVKEVRHDLPAEKFDTLICVDCADITRLGKYAKAYENFKGCTINIDHHISNNGFAKYNYIRVCPASCEIMIDVLSECGFEITKPIANLLMLGMITDSGNFTHTDVTENTYLVAAKLRAKGADPNMLNYETNTRQSKARAVLFGRVVSKMRFALEDKFAFLIISKADLEEAGADKSVTEGFVDFPLTVDGVEVSASLMEVKKRQYKISLRSKGKVNVNAVAVSFGGGGHTLASGFVLFGELEEVVDKLTYAISQHI